MRLRDFFGVFPKIRTIFLEKFKGGFDHSPRFCEFFFDKNRPQLTKNIIEFRKKSTIFVKSPYGGGYQDLCGIFFGLNPPEFELLFVLKF